MITASALPPLKITDADKMALRTLSAQLQRELLIQYEAFLFNQKRQVNTSQWKRVKSEGELDAFRERHVGDQRKDTGPQSAMAARSPLPRVLVAGTVPGNLDDMVYGVTFQDTAALRACYASDNHIMEDLAVLHTMDTATEEDPYRFFGIIWLLRTYPLPAALVNHRDCLLLIHTHMATLANGERVSISINHSIQHRDLPELHQFSTKRIESSLVQVLRQVDRERVEVFMVHYLDIKGNLPVTLHVLESIKYSFTTLQLAQDAGFLKKLRWLLYHNEKRRVLSSVSSSGSTGSAEESTREPKPTCELCDKPTRRLFGSRSSNCRSCSRRVCSHCVSSYDIAVESLNRKPVTESIDFCIRCVLDAKALSAATIAWHEVENHRAHNNKGVGSTQQLDGAREKTILHQASYEQAAEES